MGGRRRGGEERGGPLVMKVSLKTATGSWRRVPASPWEFQGGQSPQRSAFQFIWHLSEDGAPRLLISSRGMAACQECISSACLFSAE